MDTSHATDTAASPLGLCPRCGSDTHGLPFCGQDGELLRPFALGARYLVEASRGAGRVTAVMAGRHAVLNRRVAIKLLRPELARDRAAVARFLDAAQRVSELHHGSLLGVGDFGEDALLGLPYVVTDLASGPTLAELLRGGPLPIPYVVSTMIRIAQGLAAIHEQGLVHGDLTPRNVFLASHEGEFDSVQIDDVGLSVLSELDRAAWLAAPEYLAPEQIALGRPYDPRVDLYALGVLGYEMITGQLPFTGSSARSLVDSKLSQKTIRMPRDSRTTDVPHPLRRVIERCLAASPDERPISALEIAKELVGSRTNARFSEPPPEPVESLIGQSIGPYRVVSELGSGGVGEVFLAEHERLGTKVAIKVLRADVATIPGAVERFEQEARAASAIGERCIPSFYDFGMLEDGRPYAIMEYLRGETLADLLEKNGPLGVEETRILLSQVARAMSRAHALGIVHRDLKPENLFLLAEGAGTPSEASVRILDFGIAKVLSPELAASTNHTHVGSFMGTPDHCAPEQIYGGEVGPRTDVYALGSIAFAMLSGRPPFVAASPSELLMQKSSASAPRLGAIRANVPPSVDEAVGMMLERDPALRPASMQEALVMLDAWSAERTGPRLARPHDLDDDAQRNTPWIPLVALIAMVLVTAGIGAAVMLAPTSHLPLGDVDGVASPKEGAHARSIAQLDALPGDEELFGRIAADDLPLPRSPEVARTEDDHPEPREASDLTAPHPTAPDLTAPDVTARNVTAPDVTAPDARRDAVDGPTATGDSDPRAEARRQARHERRDAERSARAPSPTQPRATQNHATTPRAVIGDPSAEHGASPSTAGGHSGTAPAPTHPSDVIVVDPFQGS
ncbi:MAG: protein kinase [Sandaracinaceae bacterium]